MSSRKRHGVGRTRPLLRMAALTAGTAVILTAAAASASGCGRSALPEVVLDVGGHEITVEVAADPDTRQQGLMDRKTLREDRGMLFVFEKESRLSFWMKNTLVPLSIAFIAADGTIRQIEDMEPLSLDPVVSSRSVLYALEANRGWFERRGIGPGDVVTIPPEFR